MSKIPKYFKVEVGRKGAGIKVTPIFDDDNIVEVVRCEGCIYNLGKLSDKYVKCENSLRADLTDNDFCSAGIRRENK